MNEKEKMEELRHKSAEKGNDNTKLSKEEQEKLDAIIEASKQPVVLTDAEFNLGPRELDVRNLSAKN